MKIPGSIRGLYDDQKVINDRLKEAVDTRFIALKATRWHYESRVKSLPSFALKIESGRFQNPRALEDFFACTLVVANASEVDQAESLVTANFAVKERRPPTVGRTHKRPDSFPFDDLRLYATLPSGPAVPPTDLGDIVFEIQLKTFLQHAWSIATHDLVYKADDASWSKERIAFQIKAMLEHAEVSIQEAERLATNPALVKSDERTERTREGIALLRSQWSPDELPPDVRRLAENVNQLISAINVTHLRLGEILKEGKAARSGSHPSNLSPYSTVIQYLFGAEKQKMVDLLTAPTGRRRVLVPAEVEVPADISRAALVNAILV